MPTLASNHLRGRAAIGMPGTSNNNVQALAVADLRSEARYWARSAIALRSCAQHSARVRDDVYAWRQLEYAAAWWGKALSFFRLARLARRDALWHRQAWKECATQWHLTPDGRFELVKNSSVAGATALPSE